MDVHPIKNGINRYWSIPTWHHQAEISEITMQHAFGLTQQSNQTGFWPMHQQYHLSWLAFDLDSDDPKMVIVIPIKFHQPNDVASKFLAIGDGHVHLGRTITEKKNRNLLIICIYLFQATKLKPIFLGNLVACISECTQLAWPSQLVAMAHSNETCPVYGRAQPAQPAPICWQKVTGCYPQWSCPLQWVLIPCFPLRGPMFDVKPLGIP